MAEEIIREGTWTCPNCSRENRGRDVKCGSCGQARENVEFKYDENAEAVSDTDQLSVAAGGADWVCGFCSTSNRARETKCRQCSGARSEGTAREVKDVPLGEGPRPTPASSAAPTPASGGGSRTVLGVMAALMALFMGCFCVSFEKQVTLAAAQWNRSIAVEKLLPVTEEGWNVPTGGKVQSSWQAVHHHDQIQTGTRQVQETYKEKVQRGTKRVKTGVKNMGNGYFKETWETKPVYEYETRSRTVTKPVYTSIPRYQTRYRYEIMRWTKVREVATRGEDTNPQWGAVTLAEGEREGPRTSNCRVELATGGKKYGYVPSESLFAQLKLGARYKADITISGAVTALRLE